MEPSSFDMTERPAAAVRVRVRDGGPQGYREIEVPASDFDPSERGVALGYLFIPWHRVVRWESPIRQAFTAEQSEAPSRITVRVVIDDGTTDGATYTVPADRFETDAISITLLVENRVEPDAGDVVMRRLSFPWHTVIEYERIVPVEEPTPDAEPEPTAWSHSE